MDDTDFSIEIFERQKIELAAMLVRKEVAHPILVSNLQIMMKEGADILCIESADSDSSAFSVTMPDGDEISFYGFYSHAIWFQVSLDWNEHDMEVHFDSASNPEFSDEAAICESIAADPMKWVNDVIAISRERLRKWLQKQAIEAAA